MAQRLIKGLDTKLIHAGEPEPRIGGAVTMPIFQSSTFEYIGQTNYHDLRYIRLNNTPNHAVLHAKLAALENAEAALVAGSADGGDLGDSPNGALSRRASARAGLRLRRHARPVCRGVPALWAVGGFRRWRRAGHMARGA